MRQISGKSARHSDRAREAGAWRNLPANATPSSSALAPAGAHVGRCLDFARSLGSRAPLDMTVVTHLLRQALLHRQVRTWRVISG
jgi:hypothetical protein